MYAWLMSWFHSPALTPLAQQVHVLCLLSQETNGLLRELICTLSPTGQAMTPVAQVAQAQQTSRLVPQTPSILAPHPRPRTGDDVMIVTRTSIAEDQQARADAAARLARHGQPIR